MKFENHKQTNKVLHVAGRTVLCLCERDGSTAPRCSSTSA